QPPRDPYASVSALETDAQIHVDIVPCLGFNHGCGEGAELDLLVMRGNTRRGFEVKRTTVPEISKSMRIAFADLSLDS
ncbi:MAG TPA: hypothetical protein VF518_05760, partial [Polyangia bacterium]